MNREVSSITLLFGQNKLRVSVLTVLLVQKIESLTGLKPSAMAKELGRSKQSYDWLKTRARAIEWPEVLRLKELYLKHVKGATEAKFWKLVDKCAQEDK